MKKLLRKIALILVMVVVVAAIAKDQILKHVISQAATRLTGARVTMEVFSLGVFKQSVSITGFKMYNPQGFPEEVMIDIPLVSVSCRILELTQKKLVIPKAEFTLKEIVLIRNAGGKLNVNSLAFSEKKEKEPVKQKDEPAGGKQEEMMAMQIDELILDIGRVVYKDYSSGDQPVIKVYEAGIKKTYKNITSPRQLAGLILTESLQQTALKGAALYGVATLTGPAMPAVAATSVLIGKDSAAAEFPVTLTEAFAACKAVLTQMGSVTVENPETGVLKAKVQGSDAAVKIVEIQENTVKVTASARTLLIPKPEIARGIVREITAKLK
ncbi:MAG: AsmA family protein [Candidatus Omnitrophica bacterium]|nr:AsmA family protein [Candidatus Omnitrophota bacterium]